MSHWRNFWPLIRSCLSCFFLLIFAYKFLFVRMFLFTNIFCLLLDKIRLRKQVFKKIYIHKTLRKRPSFWSPLPLYLYFLYGLIPLRTIGLFMKFHDHQSLQWGSVLKKRLIYVMFCDRRPWCVYNSRKPTKEYGQRRDVLPWDH